MQLITPQIFRVRRVRRTAEIGGKVPDRTKVTGLSLGRETTDRHILDHTSAQRADGCIGHHKLLSMRVRFKTSKP